MSPLVFTALHTLLTALNRFGTLACVKPCSLHLPIVRASVAHCVQGVLHGVACCPARAGSSFGRRAARKRPPAIFCASGHIATGIAVDRDGNAVVTGRSNSTDYPVQSTIETYYDSYEVVVSKLNAAGSALIYSTYLTSGSGDNATGVGSIPPAMPISPDSPAPATFLPHPVRIRPDWPAAWMRSLRS